MPWLPYAVGGAVVVMGGWLCASTNANPGDISYGTKTAIVEPVSAALTVSPASRAELASDRAEARLEEALDVSADGDLTMRVATELANRFLDLADEAEARILALAETDLPRSVELAANFEANLDGLADRIGAEADVAVGDEARALAQLAVAAEAEKDDARNLRVRLEGELDAPEVEAKVRRLQAAAEKKVAEARALLDRERVTLGADASADVETQISLAENAAVGARALLEGGAFAQAGDLFSVSANMAEEAKVFTQLSSEIESDVDGPKQEMRARNLLNQARERVSAVKALLDQNRAELDADAVTDIEAQLKVADRALATGETHLEAEAFGRAGNLFAVASRVANETETLIDINLDTRGEEALDAARDLLNSTRSKIDETRRLIDSRSSSLGAEVTAEANAQLNAAANTLGVAEAQIEAGNTSEAGAIIQSADNVTTETGVFADIMAEGSAESDNLLP